MSSLMVATQVILPLLILMSFGVLLRKTGVLEETTYKKINVLIFKALLPVLLFKILSSILSTMFCVFCVEMLGGEKG